MLEHGYGVKKNLTVPKKYVAFLISFLVKLINVAAAYSSLVIRRSSPWGWYMKKR
jgi:hypothetical protein